MGFSIRRLALCVLAAVLLSPCAALAAQGYWKLTNTKAEGTKKQDTVAEIGTNQAKLDKTWQHFSQVLTVAATATWTGPPETAVPGQKITFNGSLVMTKNEYSFGFVGHSLSYGAVYGQLTPCGATHSGQGFFLISVDSPTGAKQQDGGSGVWDVPDNKSGGVLWLQVELDGGCIGRVIYTYNWVDGTPPAGAGTVVAMPGVGSGGKASTGAGGAAGTGGATAGGAGASGTASGTGGTGASGTGGAAVSLAPCPSSATSQSIQACSVKARSGETVNVPVWLIAGRDLGNVNMDISYDASVAQAAGKAVKGGHLGQALFESNVSQAGLTRLGFAGSAGIGGNGQVATIPFKVVGKPGQRTQLGLKVTTANVSSGAPAQIAAISGEIVVVADAATGTTGVSGTGTTPGATGTTGTTGTTAPPGASSTGSSGLPPGKYSAMDALAALKMSVGTMPSDTKYDVDKNGQVTSNDARLILMSVVGK